MVGRDFHQKKQPYKNFHGTGIRESIFHLVKSYKINCRALAFKGERHMCGILWSLLQTDLYRQQIQLGTTKCGSSRMDMFTVHAKRRIKGTYAFNSQQF